MQSEEFSRLIHYVNYLSVMYFPFGRREYALKLLEQRNFTQKKHSHHGYINELSPETFEQSSL